MPRTGSVSKRSGAALLAIALLALCALTATPALASTKKKGFTVKVKSGTLTLTLTAQAQSDIDSGSATVGRIATPISPATATGAVYSFPISHGTLNSATGHGTVGSSGGLTLESHLSIAGLFESSSSASASNPSASLNRTSMLDLTSANFSPPTVPMFTLNLAHAKVTGNRHSISIKGIPALLTAAGVQFFGATFKTAQEIATVTIAAKG
jgi:Htaa